MPGLWSKRCSDAGWWTTTARRSASRSPMRARRGEYRFEHSYSRVELIPYDGPAIPGDDKHRLYEVVGTSFWNGLLPMVRYRTGDLVRLPADWGERELLELSMGLRTFDGVLGRQQETPGLSEQHPHHRHRLRAPRRPACAAPAGGAGRFRFGAHVRSAGDNFTVADAEDLLAQCAHPDSGRSEHHGGNRQPAGAYAARQDAADRSSSAGSRRASTARRRTTVHTLIAMQQPGWYLQRLRGMSGAEVAHRLARKMRLLSQKFVSHELPPRDEAATRPSFPAAVHVASLPSICGPPPIACSRENSASSISTTAISGDPPQWNRDPLTRRDAGARRASAIDYRDEREVGNIKYLWEPNRHLHLPLLAQAHALTGDPQYALGIQAHIDSWIEQCPEGWGPNWVSPLELGIRLINWSITWQLLGGMRAKLFATPEGAAFRERWLSVHLPARAHDRRQPVALLLGQQPPDRRGGRRVRGRVHLAAVAADGRMGRTLPRRSSKRSATSRMLPTAATANRLSPIRPSCWISC